MVEERKSALSGLVAEVMSDKKAEARKLTPVAGEKGHFPLESAVIPNDTGVFMSNEALWDHAKQLRKFAADAIAIADGLDALTQEPSVPVESEAKVDPRFAGKDPEPKEPTDFAAAFAAKAAAAQAATFTGNEADETEAEDAATAQDEHVFGWVCPDHGKATMKNSPKTGRDYVGCPDCNLFKR